MHKTASIALVLSFSMAGCGTAAQVGRGEPLRAIPREERVALMVTPFSNATAGEQGPRYEPWTHGIPAMLMSDLESIGVFNILSEEQLDSILEQQKLQSLGLVDEREAVRIGRLAAARSLLTGTFFVSGGQLRLEARVFSVETGTLLGAAAAMGKVERFFELEKELMVRMTPLLGATLTEEERVALENRVETRSMEASLSNYAGEKAAESARRLRTQGRTQDADRLFQEARARFENALREDPAYTRPKANISRLALAIPITL